MSIQVHTHRVVLRNQTFKTAKNSKFFSKETRFLHYTTLNSTMSIRKKNIDIFHDISTNGVTGGMDPSTKIFGVNKL